MAAHGNAIVQYCTLYTYVIVHSVKSQVLDRNHKTALVGTEED